MGIKVEQQKNVSHVHHIYLELANNVKTYTLDSKYLLSNLNDNNMFSFINFAPILSKKLN